MAPFISGSWMMTLIPVVSGVLAFFTLSLHAEDGPVSSKLTTSTESATAKVQMEDPAPKCTVPTRVVLNDSVEKACSISTISCNVTRPGELLVFSSDLPPLLPAEWKVFDENGTFSRILCVSGSLYHLGGKEVQISINISNQAGSVTKNISLMVKDANQSPSFLQSSSVIHLNERTPLKQQIAHVNWILDKRNGTSATDAIIVWDPDDTTANFILARVVVLNVTVSQPNKPFTIIALHSDIPIKLNETTRNFTVVGFLQAGTILNFTIQASDGEGLADEANVVFIVDDVNDPPLCPSQPLWVIHIATPVNTELFSLDCFDPDVNISSPLTYGDYNTAEPPYFSINESGSVKLRQQLPRGVTHMTYDVYVKDDGGLVTNVTAQFYVISDYPPACGVRYQHPTGVWMNGTCVQIHPNCSDPTTPGNNRYLTLTFTGKWTEDCRQMASVNSSGLAQFCYNLTHGGVDQVTKLKGTRIKFTSTMQETGNITHIKYQCAPPAFTFNHLRVNVSEMVLVGDALLTLEATVDDRAAPLTYSLAEKWGDNYSNFLSVNSTSGQVTVAVSLRPLVLQEFVVIATVEDPVSALTGTTDIIVRVEDVNEPPSCDNVIVSVPWAISVGETVTTVQCLDPDVSPQNTYLSYSVRVPPEGTPWTLTNGSVVVLGNRTRLELNPFVSTYDVVIDVMNGNFTVAAVVTIVRDPAPNIESSIDLSVQTVNAGDRVELECFVTGTPKPTVHWSKLEGRIPDSATIEEGILIIPTATPQDAGTYRCTATNAAGSVQSQVQLFVQLTTMPCPTGVRVDYASDTSALLQWTFDDLYRPFVVNFTIALHNQVSGSVMFFVTNASATSYYLSGLTLGASYLAQVRANGRLSVSAPSAVVNFTILEPETDPFISNASTVHWWRDHHCVTCPVDDPWPATIAGFTAQILCPDGYAEDNKIWRKCSEQGMWLAINTSACVKRELSNLSHMVDSEGATAGEVSKSLNSITSHYDTFLVGDLLASVDILNKMAAIISNDTGLLNTSQTLENFVQSADNLLHAGEIWEDQVQTAMELIQAMDVIAKGASMGINSSDLPPIVTDKLVVFVGKIDLDLSDIEFPQRDKSGQNYPHWLRNSSSSVFLSKEAFSEGVNEVRYSAAIYNNMSHIFSGSQLSSLTSSKHVILNSPIIALSVAVDGPLRQHVQLTFEHITSNFTETFCQFLDFRERRNASWSGEGCQRVDADSSSTVTVCTCNHLTNFAVLMSPYRPTGVMVDLLNKLTVMGCIISILFLVLTLAVYFVFWEFLTRDRNNVSTKRSKILINLCVVLIVAYVTFLVGVDRVEDKNGCTAVAAILHYVWLVAFFLMLCEGIDIFISIILVFPQKSIFIWLMVLAYGLPAIIVGISLGVTQLDGYGGPQSCWLSVDKGVLWAFVGPVVATLLANFIFVALVIRALLQSTAMLTRSMHEQAKGVIKAICVMSPILGLTWVFGVMGVNEETLVFQVLFVVFNSLQGFLIFLFHCLLSQQVRDAVRRKWRNYKTGRLETSSSANNLSSAKYDQKVARKTSVPDHDFSKSVQSSAQSQDTYLQTDSKVDSSESHQDSTQLSPVKEAQPWDPLTHTEGEGRGQGQATALFMTNKTYSAVYTKFVCKTSIPDHDFSKSVQSTAQSHKTYLQTDSNVDSRESYHVYTHLSPVKEAHPWDPLTHTEVEGKVQGEATPLFMTNKTYSAMYTKTNPGRVERVGEEVKIAAVSPFSRSIITQSVAKKEVLSVKADTYLYQSPKTENLTPPYTNYKEFLTATLLPNDSKGDNLQGERNQGEGLTRGGLESPKLAVGSTSRLVSRRTRQDDGPWDPAATPALTDASWPGPVLLPPPPCQQPEPPVALSSSLSAISSGLATSAAAAIRPCTHPPLYPPLLTKVARLHSPRSPVGIGPAGQDGQSPQASTLETDPMNASKRDEMSIPAEPHRDDPPIDYF